MNSAVREAARLGRGATYLYLQTLLTILLTTLLFVVMVWKLTPQDFGAFAAISVIYMLFQCFTSIGVHVGVVRFVAEHCARGEPDLARAYASTAINIVLITIAVGLCTVILLSHVIVSFTRLYGYEYLLPPLLASLLFSTPMQLGYGLVQSLQDFSHLAVYRLTDQVLRKLIGISLLLLGYGILGVLVGWIVGDGTAALLSILHAVRRLGYEATFSHVRALLAFSLPAYGARILTSLTIFLDRILLWLFIPAWMTASLVRAEVGIYTVMATAAGFIIDLFSTPFFFAFYAGFAQEWGAAGLESVTGVFHYGSRYTLAVAIPAALLPTVIAPPAVTSLLPSYSRGAFALVILLLAIAAAALLALSTSALYALGRSLDVLIATGVGVLCYFITGAILVPTSLMNGAAIARFVGYIVSALAAALLLHRHRAFALDSGGTLRCLVAALVATILSLGIVQVTALFTISGLLTNLLVYGFITMSGLLLYLVILSLVGFFKPEDIEFLQAYLPKRVAPFTIRILRLLVKQRK